MRVRTRSLLDGQTWDIDEVRVVARFFDELAGDWNDRFGHEDRAAPLADAARRGGPIGGDRCLELGSGTGLTSAWLAGRFAAVLAFDLSLEMLRRAPAGVAPRVCADGAALPVPDGSVDSVALINMFLFPVEVARVLTPLGHGTVVWVSSAGPHTPIYLPPDEVAAALPGTWDGVASTCGEASWCVLRRVADGGGGDHLAMGRPPAATTASVPAVRSLPDAPTSAQTSP